MSAAKPRGLGTADELYKPQQLGHVLPHLPFIPSWMIDLGPGSAVEFLKARERWPGIRLFGMEPSPLGYQFARDRWPADGVLLRAAAWDRNERRMLHKAHDLLHGTLFVDWEHIVRDDPGGTSGDTDEIECWTLDTMDERHGPFHDALLWLDVEGAELRVLRGASGLLARGAIVAINIESRPDTRHLHQDLLTRHGFRHVHSYFECETVRDEVWIR